MGQKEINFVEQLIILGVGIFLFIWWFNRSDREDRKTVKSYFQDIIHSVAPVTKKFSSPEVPKKINKKEEMCRGILEKIFNMPFPNIRPSWLLNPDTGRPLELDCYNEKLKIALEYDGEQHYKHVGIFHRTGDALAKQIERDAHKTRLCEKHGIALVRVPYYIEEKNLESYITGELRTILAKT